MTFRIKSKLTSAFLLLVSGGLAYAVSTPLAAEGWFYVFWPAIYLLLAGLLLAAGKVQFK